jgi:hypothetical protein
MDIGNSPLSVQLVPVQLKCMSTRIVTETRPIRNTYHVRHRQLPLESHAVGQPLKLTTHLQQDACLIHVVEIFRNYHRIIQLLAHQGESWHCFLVNTYHLKIDLGRAVMYESG